MAELGMREELVSILRRDDARLRPFFPQYSHFELLTYVCYQVINLTTSRFELNRVDLTVHLLLSSIALKWNGFWV